MAQMAEPAKQIGIHLFDGVVARLAGSERERQVRRGIQDDVTGS